MVLTLSAPADVSKTIFCTALITENTAVCFGDDYFYNFIGKAAGIILEEYIHPDYLEEFLSALKDASSGKKVRLLTFIAGANKEYQLMDITISLNEKASENEMMYGLSIYNVFGIEGGYMHCSDDANRYRTYLSLYEGYLFDYDVEADIITAFAYRTLKSTVFVKCTLREFAEKMHAFCRDEQEQKDCDKFCKDLADGNANFSYNVKAAWFSNEGESGTFHIDGRVIYRNDRHKMVVGVVRPIDKNLTDELPVYALPEGKDSFTGLLNKRACQEYVKDAIAAKSNRHYMAIIDVDNFKVVNDTYGHLFGDKVIMEIANILNSSLNGRGIVSHFGGDEFLLFTDWIETEVQIRSLLTYIRQRVKETFRESKNSCRITLSIGVASYPEDGSDYYELFEKADKCLYLAKNKGRNRFIIYDEQKHGRVSVEGNVVSEMIDPTERAEQLAGTVAEMSIRILREGKDNLQALLEELRTDFGIDGIRIYSRAQGRPICSVGVYPAVLDLGTFVTEGKICLYFEQKNYMVSTNFVNFKVENKELYEIMAAGDIRGTVCCYMPGASGEAYYFFFDAIGRKIIWTEADKNYFLMLGRMIAEVL